MIPFYISDITLFFFSICYIITSFSYVIMYQLIKFWQRLFSSIKKRQLSIWLTNSYLCLVVKCIFNHMFRSHHCFGSLLMKVTIHFVECFLLYFLWSKRKADDRVCDDAIAPPSSFVFLSLKWSSNPFENVITITIDVVSWRRWPKRKNNWLVLVSTIWYSWQIGH
jgi:hypothetical protein